MGNIIGAVLGEVNPFSSIKNIIVMIAVALILGTAGTVIYKGLTADKKIGALTQEVKQAEQAVVNANDTIAKTADSNVATNNAEEKTIKVIKVITTNREQRIAEVKQKEAVVISDPVATPEQKQKSIDTIEITSLWADYCAAVGNEHTSCKPVVTSDIEADVFET